MLQPSDLSFTWTRSWSSSLQRTAMLSMLYCSESSSAKQVDPTKSYLRCMRTHRLLPFSFAPPVPPRSRPSLAAPPAGLVVTPFLPGDSLLFACGALCALGSLQATRPGARRKGGVDEGRREKNVYRLRRRSVRCCCRSQKD